MTLFKVGETLTNVTAPEDKGHFLCSVQTKHIIPGKLLV